MTERAVCDSIQQKRKLIVYNSGNVLCPLKTNICRVLAKRQRFRAVYDCVDRRWSSGASDRSGSSLQVEVWRWAQVYDGRVECHRADHWTVSPVHFLLFLHAARPVRRLLDSGDTQYVLWPQFMYAVFWSQRQSDVKCHCWSACSQGSLLSRAHYCHHLFVCALRRN